ncbi:MAG TPA: DUF2336 domain-containing protein [Stellaceae bacterium]|jgi:uncharacterized protein (DUF2336 family)
MKGLLQRVFDRVARGAPIDYEESKRLTASADPADRRRVASRPEIQPEVLYYLAADPDPGVRSAIAANDATPVQADLLLARDRDEEVRGALARKIARLAPGLTAAETDRLRRITFETLEILARDQAVRIRRILAETLQLMPDAPVAIVRQLARDDAIEVAGPILRFSPLLGSDDLLDIIAAGAASAALVAIADREGLGTDVAEAVAATDDDAAVAVLLANGSVQLREETIDRLAEEAANHPRWHRPLVARPRLSDRAIRRLAQFVAADLLARLTARSDLDPRTAAHLERVVMARLDGSGGGRGDACGAAAAADPDEAALARARQAQACGTLDASFVLDAAGQDRRLAAAGLALLAGVPLAVVDQILTAGSAKGAAALAWKAGLDATAAVQIQLRLARIPPASVLRASADGRYPLAPAALQWQIEFFASVAADTKQLATAGLG